MPALLIRPPGLNITDTTRPVSRNWSADVRAIPSLYSWCSFDAANVVLDGSNGIASVNDLSGNGHGLTQATGANRPLWVSDGLASYPVARFTAGSAQRLDMASFATAGDHTKVIIARSAAPIEVTQHLMGDSSPASTEHVLYFTVSLVSGALLFTGRVGNVTLPISTIVDPTIWHVYWSFWVGSTSTLGVQVDALAAVSGVMSVTPPLNNSLFIGNNDFSNAAFGGDIEEVMVFAANLSDPARAADLAAVQSYIANKVGL
jgi:hypothetical protein